ncbi:acetyl-CoA carboxylase biotin carboxyl carrier protein subunit [Cytobacillus horneckiae]|uniref:acetyl-CoA carboxylase biotin carboxyl carrier protein subunit n=1 Tax=Cytobacillus horneckiae TaxID=549687 RepID=UPI00115844F6|nr:acetyl-CoA carboxylase biotin carboxyl carrier protein subunit [Cytobacillus horneckiae]MBN6885477.1 acetyl-CoA carboxylase biotin carboxyl carrier protein subunit [Cytobacillus horneckiae]MEC1158788.1 acetyl-CoA carboxylase biotin carboxyl carrier protein subunit [Cytobacillus horneckiae]MED2937311.1 acetyl-CoA carboxylase biotin carboxyl carrier protein subunit [Cytobacillus horneckiae]NRG45588.1 acetyl-CoA carboxylase biotin carboxyl carrier protein subunit [Bacillus sp. CRN 9]
MQTIQNVNAFITEGKIMIMLKSHMAGTVFKVLVQEGDEVQPGREVFILESMKMEIPVTAETNGRVCKVKANVGDFVNEGDVVLELDE